MQTLFQRIIWEARIDLNTDRVLFISILSRIFLWNSLGYEIARYDQDPLEYRCSASISRDKQFILNRRTSPSSESSFNWNLKKLCSLERHWCEPFLLNYRHFPCISWHSRNSLGLSSNQGSSHYQCALSSSYHRVQT